MADKPVSRVAAVQRPKVDRKARLKLPAIPILKQDPELRRCNWNEVVLGFEGEEQAIDEATRCIQCPGAPCIPACPVQNDIPGALWLLELGDFVGAANKFRETSTMPEVCGRICPQERLCEGSCVVGNPKLNMRPVAIGRLEAFVADYQRRTQGLPKPPPVPPTGHTVAVVGGGPAGLSVAELLAAKGHSVTIFDLWPRLGGILRYGIPNFKMEKSLLEDKEIFLEELGVKFVGGVTIGKGMAVDDLLARGFDAVFLGHGTPVDASTGVLGEELKEVWHATEFLVRGNLPPEELPPNMREPLNVGKKVAVIGGGDTSMDCVRTAVRLGADEVTCVYRRTEAEMPGRGEERIHAKEEGVKFYFLAAPLRFLGDESGQVKGVECVRMELGEPDASGRRSPVPIPGSEFFFEADMVVLAVGYGPDPLIPEGTVGLDSRKGGVIVVEPETGQTSRPGLFAGGDNIRGADLVVTAVADGKRAADAMDAYLRSLDPKP